MPLSLVSAQTLAIGAFNPYIITPEWLVKNKICEDEEVEIRFMPLIPLNQGLAFSFKEAQWQVDFRLLSVASRKENCGTSVAKVIETLPHTPIHAIGNNFHYACIKDDWGNSPLPSINDGLLTGLKEIGQVEQTRCTYIVRKDTVRIEVTVAIDEPDLAILFNFHRETKSAIEAQDAANLFDSDQQWSQTLLQDIFGQQVVK